MRPHPTSINDIARALNVSASTVSRALKDHPDISKATRQRIQAFAREMNYRPNALALGLRSQRSHTLGIVVPEIVHHFFSTIISGIEDLAYSKGYRVMICQSTEDYQREVVNLQALMDHRVDGMLVSFSKQTLDFSHFNSILENRVPLVFLDRFCKEIETDRVLTDDFQGAKVVTNHLIRRGCRRILHLAAPQNLQIGRERFEGYRQALLESEIPLDDKLVLLCDTSSKLRALQDHIMTLVKDIDGVFAVNDLTAISMMQLLQEKGFEIPARIAVAGFGDDPIASIVRPQLTTVQQKGYEMGREAARLLIQRLEKPETLTAPRTRVFPASLRIRESA